MGFRTDSSKVLNINNISEEGDPVFSCYFKTELASVLLQLTSASINVLIGSVYVAALNVQPVSEQVPR